MANNEKYEQGKRAAKEFADSVNSYSDEGVRGFVDGFKESHPTLQQSMFGGFLKLCKELSEEDDWDDRKKASVHTARKIMEALNGSTQLPFI